MSSLIGYSPEENKKNLPLGNRQIGTYENAKHILFGHGEGEGNNWKFVGSSTKVYDYINKKIPANEKVWCVVCIEGKPVRVDLVQGKLVVSKGLA